MKIKLFTLALLGCLGLAACDKDPDPCAALKPVSADFDFYDGNTKIDTFMLPAKVTFKAKDSTALSYAWSFPNGENTSNKREFSLTFHNEVGHVPVQLILRNKPQTACFPKDDGIDTVQKSIYLFHWSEANRLPNIGTFIGTHEDTPNKKFEIHIKTFSRPDPEPRGWYGVGTRIFNLPEGCGNGDTTIVSWAPSIAYDTYKTFKVDGYGSVGNGCPQTWGNGVINGDKLIIDYSIGIWNVNTKKLDITKRKFIGYRKK